MNNDIAIKVEHVSKTFKLPHEKSSSVKSALINFARHKRGYEVQHVLDDISFEIKKGEFFGIVGRNGSGKSTLLKLLAGIYTPTKGEIQINGKLTPFIELGVGFNPELTGRENVFLNGALLGFNRKEMDTMYDDIVAFAELERFMDQKLKNYSSGMQVRLAFSIAIKAQGSILLLDEVLAVGDMEFQRKCYDYFMKLKEQKKTVVLVTHDMNAVRQYCDRALMIDKGEVIAEGGPDEVSQSYRKLFAAETDLLPRPLETDERFADRWGEGSIQVIETRAEVQDQHVTITTIYKANKDTDAPIFGFTIFGPSGVNILESNTFRQRYKTHRLKKADEVKLQWSVPNIFTTGNYKVSVACCDLSASTYYDWVNSAAKFRITREGETAGIVDPTVIIVGK